MIWGDVEITNLANDVRFIVPLLFLLISNNLDVLPVLAYLG